MLVQANVRLKIKRPPPKIVKARSYKLFDREKFVNEIKEAPWSACSAFDNPDDCYQTWSNLFSDICDRHAPFREIKIRSWSLPWITPQIRHSMNLRYKTLLKAKKSGNQDLWTEYKVLRNRVTKEVRIAKSAYYTNLFEEVRDCKSYWKLIKNAASCHSTVSIKGIRKPDGLLETTDQGKADLLNVHFSTVGEKLANEIRESNQQVNWIPGITRVTPTVMQITLSSEDILLYLKNLKADKSSGPDKVAPKLLKLADESIIPSLMSVYLESASSNTVPKAWKFANVLPLFKKDDETERDNFRPISLLCVPGKIMESCVASTIKTHITEHGLSNSKQWAYKKGHSTEMLLVKMTEDWRRALDSHQSVGIVFVDFRKAFDSISHHILLQKLLSLGISGNLWCWISDYLSDRSQVTIVNGCKSNPMPVNYGVPQGSVLGPILFSLFCNDLPDICEEDEGSIHMYADDTTIYVTGQNPDLVAIKLNKILSTLREWSIRNLLTPHPLKTEFVLLRRDIFIGPLQGIKLGSTYIKQVESSRCLGLEIDHKLKWTVHVTELTRSFSQKLNLLKSLYFLPINARTDFYFKVILPSITYGLGIWGSCGKTLFDELEKIHIRAAKSIHRLDWNTPTEEVLNKTKWKTLRATYSQRLLYLAFNCYHGNHPVFLQSLFTKFNSKYNLRRKQTLVLPKSKTDYLKKSISYQASFLWNSLDNNTRAIDIISTFKRAINKLF